MIGYDGLTTRDLRWYWENSNIIHNSEDYGHIPMTYRGINADGQRTKVLAEMDDSVTVDLICSDEVMRAKVGPDSEGIMASTHPVTLFEDNDVFLTYRPFLGVIQYDDWLFYGEGTATRARNKGIVLGGGGGRNTRFRTVVKGKKTKVIRDMNSDQIALVGLCRRLDDPPALTRKQLLATLNGKQSFAVHDSLFYVLSDGGCYINGQQVALATLNKRKVEVTPLNESNKLATQLVENIIQEAK